MMKLICILFNVLNILHDSQAIDEYYVNTKVEIHKNELTESQKEQALGIGLSELQSGTNLDTIADKLIKHFSHEYGGHWYCTITTSVFAAKFDSQPNSLIWFSIGSIHIVLFKPGFMTPNDLVQESKHINGKTSIIQTEMNSKMNNLALNVSMIAIQAFNQFDLIAKNISKTFDEEFGNSWQCIIGQKGLDASISYVNGSYINFIIEDLEIILFQTNQPKYKTDFHTILNEAKNSEVIVNNKTDPFMMNEIITITKSALSQNISSDDCYVEYKTKNVSHSLSCYYKIAKFIKTKLHDKYKSGWSVTVGDPNYYSDSTIGEKNYFDFYFGRLLFILTEY